ncbi:MAG: dienelactone hydrolase family protein [Chloroherpetonaceae bacterium]
MSELGQMVSFKANGGTAQGYLAKATSGKGIGVIVLQEWWGLVDHIKNVCDRFARAGFTALAPDMYDGATTKSPDEAGKLFMALNIGEAEKKLRGAIDFLLSHEAVSSKKVGTIGFCMGGQLSLFAATLNDKIGACVDFYGVHPAVKPDFTKLNAPVLGIFAEKDDFVNAQAVLALETQLQSAGKRYEFHTYPNTTHAFFNDTRPDVYDAKATLDAWNKTLAFFKAELGS